MARCSRPARRMAPSGWNPPTGKQLAQLEVIDASVRSGNEKTQNGSAVGAGPGTPDTAQKRSHHKMLGSFVYSGRLGAAALQRAGSQHLGRRVQGADLGESLFRRRQKAPDQEPEA